MDVHIHVKIILTNPEQKILLIKRSYGNKTRDIPWGALEYPETIEEGLMRELREEVWITHVHSLQIKECISSYNKDEDKYVVFMWYIWTTPESAIHLSKEHEDYKWATKEESLEVGMTPYLVDFIHKCGL